jgi:hypothetical protein
VFIAAGQTYQISRHCLQHFDNYFHFSSFLLILKGLLQKIFSASPATSGENEAQSINSRENQERIKGEVFRKPIHPLERISSTTAHHRKQATDVISALSTSL